MFKNVHVSDPGYVVYNIYDKMKAVNEDVIKGDDLPSCKDLTLYNRLLVSVITLIVGLVPHD